MALTTDQARPWLAGLSFHDCDRCGAVVYVKCCFYEDADPGGPPAVDNEAAHAEWHRLQDELLALLADSAAKSLRARLHALLRKLWRL
jgi:hypothetical protein